MEKLKIFYLKYKHAVPLNYICHYLYDMVRLAGEEHHRALPDHTYGGG